MKKRLVLLMVLVVIVAAIAGCAKPATQPPEQEQPKEKSQVVFALWSAPEGVFNYNLYESRYDADSMGPMFEGLLKRNPDLSYKAGLADVWEVKDGGLVFYFKLRDDVFFHDGKKVTTDDVKFTFEWMMHKDYTGVRASNWQYIKGYDAFKKGETTTVEGIKVINEREIEFHFSQIDAPAFGTLSTWPISPKHVFEGTPIGQLKDHPGIKNPIGAGPFKFVRYVPGQFVEMEAFENYHYGRPKLDVIIVKVANADVAVAELLTKSVDAAWVQPNKKDWNNFKGSGFLSIIEYAQNGYQYMGLQNEHPLFNDRRVRQALTYAIDRPGIVKNLLDGMGVVQFGHMSTVSWAFNDKLTYRPYDPEKAKQLLEEAGWVLRNDGFRYKDNKKFSFKLSYPTGNPVRMNSALVIQQNLKDVGIEVVLDIMEFATLSTKVYQNRDFEAYLMGWGLAADPDATSIWGPGENWNAVNFNHPRNGELLKAGRSVVEQEKRKPIYDEWQELLFEENPYVWLYAGLEAYVFNGALKEFKPNPFGIWWDVELWHWDGQR